MRKKSESSSSVQDESILSTLHWRMVITAGIGFFTDAYDLFIIGVVTVILSPIWKLSTLQVSLLNGAALASAAFGAVFFGWLSDRFGRKRMYGFEIMLLFIGTILSAISPNYVALFLARILVGIGIGGDYPTSAAVTSESANRKNRGLLVLLVFGMQALGLVVGPLLASFFLVLHIPEAYLWRILLALGAIPAASVFMMRRRIAETPRFCVTQKAPVEVSRSVSYFLGRKGNTYGKRYTQTLFRKRWIQYLIGTAGAWFLLDVAFYGNSVSSMLIMEHLASGLSLSAHTFLSAMLFLFFAMPGYILAAKYVDRIGRKRLQILGFCVMAICYFFLALFSDISANFTVFLLLFGLSFFFVNFGPNTTTFLIPSEIYPTAIRARAHGISAAVGKIGAFLGAFILPGLLAQKGFHTVMFCLSFVSLLGIGVTLLVPEMKQMSLSEVE